MFWNKKPNYNGREDNGYQPLPTYEDIKVPTKPEDATYMIGTLDDGRVQLRVGYPTSITLTMNDVAVRKMIKLLEAAMDNEGDKSNDC